jgi:glycosyltransferase involved in cell wall biosynthesis
MPWLAHVVRRIGQAQQKHDVQVELVLVDSSDDQVDMEVFDGAAQVGVHVRKLRAPHGNLVGAKFQQALVASEGDYVTLLGDDDWQHPERILAAASYLDKHPEHDWFGWFVFWYLHLETMECRRHVSTVPVPSALVVRRPVALDAGFDTDLPRASDTRWAFRFIRLTDAATQSRWPGQMGDVTQVPFVSLVHGRNMSPRPGKQHFSTPWSMVREQLEEADVWTAADDDALASLRGRLGFT